VPYLVWSENKNFFPQIWTYPQTVSFEFNTNGVLTPFLFFKNRAQTSPFHKKSGAWAFLLVKDKKPTGF